MFVKICGITNEEDALLAVAMDADAVGFMFAPSPRQVTTTVVRDIVHRLPHEVLTVGVFRDQQPQRVVGVVNQLGLRGAQLHGHESPAEAEWVRRRVPFVIKAFAADDHMVERIGDYDVDAIHIEGSKPGAGLVFDWSLAENLPMDKPIIVAGGLTPDNVAEAISRLDPWGVDVSSGVEREPGRKDPVKVMRFISAAKAFDDADDDIDPTRPIDLAALAEEPEVYDYDWEEDAHPA